MNSPEYLIRPSSPKRNGTPQFNEPPMKAGKYDRDCFYNADPNGFLLGFLDDKPITSISVVRYDDNFGLLGFYIVKPEFRGLGYGLKIGQARKRHDPGI